MSGWQVAAGVWGRQISSLFRNVRRLRLLGKRRLVELEPLLRDRELLGGAEYSDTVYDPTRLTVAMARSASASGASISSYTTVESLVTVAGNIRGVMVRDSLTGTVSTLHSATAVNAAGAGTEAVRRLEDDSTPSTIRWIQTVYITVSQERLGHRNALTLASPLDGRLLHITAMEGLTTLGVATREVDEGSASTIIEDDIVYLLRSANAYFPRARLTKDDVLAAWCHVLPSTSMGDMVGGNDTRHRIEVGLKGMVTVVGGGIGSAPQTARETVDHVIGELRAQGIQRGQSAPAPDEPLPGGEAHDFTPLRPPGVDIGLSESTIDHLLATFGTEVAAIYNLCRDHRHLMSQLHPDHPAVLAEVVHCARRELVVTVDDVLSRRLHVRWQTADAGRVAAEPTADALKTELGWTSEQCREATERYVGSLAEVGLR